MHGMLFMKTIIAITMLWLIAIAATFFITRDTGLFTYLGPVYFVCMIGSIVIARKNIRPQT